MTKKEFAMLAAAIRTYYPKEQILPNEQALGLWYAELQDIPYNIATTALRKWVSTNKWSPTIADIRETASEIANGETQDWGEAWEKVMKAISKYGWYNQEAALASFDDLTRETVRRIGFRSLCDSDNLTADRANFRMVYETLANRRKVDQQISPELHEAVKKIYLDIGRKLSLEGVTGDVE